jgi:outer membrane protein OmpA-like peptidoglycan-associated protein
MNGALVVPSVEGPINLPTKVHWDLTGLVALPTPVDSEHTYAFETYAAAATRTAQAMRDPASPFYAFRDAFELPTLAAKCHFVDSASGAIRITHWGARPHRHGATQQWVQHASTIRAVGAVVEKSVRMPSRPMPAGRRMPRAPLLAGAGAGTALLALLGWGVTRQPAPLTISIPSANGSVASTASTPPTQASDRDQDGVPDADDACPDVAGQVANANSGDATHEPGCPRPSRDVAVLGRKLLVADSVHFALGNAKLTPAGEKVAEAVAAYLAEHAEISQLEIIGYADPTGNADSNFVLSTARALAVRQALMKLGVAETRVTVDARGANALKIANALSGDDSATHAKARRAEFWIVASAGRQLGPTQVQ